MTVQPPGRLRIVVLGLSLSSSWGNGHATTWRALLRAFAARGHDVLFLERDVPWYAAHRDLSDPGWCRLVLYRDRDDLARHREAVRRADAVIVGSYVPEGIAVGRWVQAEAGGARAFYDIDTPVTLAALAAGTCEYLDPGLLRGWDLYLSFTGGPTLGLLERRWGAARARPLYCSVDADAYRPVETPLRWDLGYLGTYSPDRQPVLDALLLEPARRAPHLRFVVAGPQYPAGIAWPANVDRIDHVGPGDHPRFYAACRYTLNVTRAAMAAAGWSPSVRLFEAAACGTPVISDTWDGIESVLDPGEEIALARGPDDVLHVLHRWSEARRRSVADAARSRILRTHDAMHRAAELERHLREASAVRASRTGGWPMPAPAAVNQ